jgi:RNA polymerase sigma factor (sigma-70 family)
MTGDVGARNAMAAANLKLAFKFARRRPIAGMEYEDVAQEAALGLLDAAEHFDPSRGLRLSSLAWACMRRRFGVAYRRRSRLETGEQSLLAEVPAPPDEDAADAELLALLHALLRGLPPREAAVIRARFGLDGGRALKAREVGAMLGVSHQYIFQVEARALGRLRARLGVPA